MKYTIIIPVYNNALTLKACLNSVLANKYPDFEVIVINDASTDQTNDILQDYREIKIIQLKENKGVAHARNQGILQAKGKYLLFTDGDCQVPSTWIKDWDTAINQLEDKYIAGSGGIEIYGNFHQKADVLALFGYNTFGQSGPTNCLFTANTFIKKDPLIQVGLFNESLRREEDRELSLRFIRQGHKLHYTPAVKIKHNPCRDTFQNYCSYAYHLGKEVGIKLEKHYSHEKGIKFLQFIYSYPFIYLLFIPPLSIIITTKILLANLQYPYIILFIPHLLIHKLIWRWGSFLWLLKNPKTDLHELLSNPKNAPSNAQSQ